ncbi:nicotinate-nucleotide adenylyltransferase [Nitrospira lenta]|uniref:Probable nicotinate-nucleotide adenylyltransferase n=1 Tax=Nitrospira lenta TaxID=1436998 RepID=A0A330L368_9BACT|nr:nicotinate-nucleotide adenylyltransferase [Nitrospira lenta]SPP63302.1 putative nicotinate-nucleotide adenylyltransferase [Nitrospira lenta]
MIPPDSASSVPDTQDSHPHRLGLFGGSFNPIHNGHLAIAREAHAILALDRTLFIPTGDPPHKQDRALAPTHHRYEMARLAIADIPGFELSDIEILRQGKSYSIDTVRELQRRYGSETLLYSLIGLDAFLDLPSWREPDALLAACSFVVISRPGQSFQALATLPFLRHISPNQLAPLDTGTLDRLDLPLASGQSIICLPLPPSPISASDIRHRIQHRTMLANLLPPPVESYILRQQLYRGDSYRTHI